MQYINGMDNSTRSFVGSLLLVRSDELRKQYQALSESDFIDLDREDLTEEAQLVYDQELLRRFPDTQPANAASEGVLASLGVYNRLEVRHDRQKLFFLLFLAPLLATSTGYPIVWGISLLIGFCTLRAFFVPSIALNPRRREIATTLFFLYRNTFVYKTIAVNEKGMVQGETDIGGSFILFPYACEKSDWQEFVDRIEQISTISMEEGELRVILETNGAGRLAAEISNFDGEEYAPLAKEIIQRFGLKEKGFPVIGLEEVFLECTREDLCVGLEWDIWSGFIVVAKNEASEPLVREIADFLKAKYERKV